MTSELNVEESGARRPRLRRGGFQSPLAIVALGVVFGDIGTSPLYTLKTCFSVANVAATPANAVAIVSLLIWTLVWVVCVKYVTILMRVDHEGEGGILALLALVAPPKILGVPVRATWIVWVVVVGAAMLFGDGIITPAISVISAVEGVGVVTAQAQQFIVPISVVVLFVLFAVQSRGTGHVGMLFGPVMVVWFLAIGASGLATIVREPPILAALNPAHAIGFITHHGVFGFLIFGAIVLCVTGAEALYADMSHFGRGPITLAWYAIVFPSLLLNYLGQGAAVIGNPHALASPFYALTTGWALPVMVVLATAATVIASQSLISGAFTLTEQAIALSLCPRMRVVHTAAQQRGQVYVPFVNVLLAVGCLLLVVTFRSSDRLASAYGLAVACTMAATDVAFYVVATRTLRWRRAIVVPLVASFLLVDGLFVLAGLPKFADGAWVPLTISAVLATISITWLEGRRCLGKNLAEQQMPISEFAGRHPGSAKQPTAIMVLMTGDPSGVPFVARNRWIASRIEDARVVLLTLVRVPRPYVEEVNRVTIDQPAEHLTRISAAFGYMEQPRIAPILTACKSAACDIDSDDTAFVYADPKIAPMAGGMPRWQRALFEVLLRLARPLPDELQIRAERRVELGVEVDV